MKCHSLFSGKNKNISSVCHLLNLPSVIVNMIMNRIE